MIRKSLFKTMEVGEGMELNSKHNRDERGFIAKQKSKGVSGWKSLKEMSKLLPWPTRILTQARLRT